MEHGVCRFQDQDIGHTVVAARKGEDGAAPTVGALDLGDGIAERCRVPGGGRDRVTRLGVTDGDGPADPAVRPGDDRDRQGASAGLRGHCTPFRAATTV